MPLSKKQPEPVVRQPDPGLPPPVADLSEDSKLLWYDIIPRRAVSPERLVLLEVALFALDRSEQCRNIIKEEGLVATTEATGAVHAHPLLKVERESRGQFLVAWSHLGLDFDPILDKPQPAY